jgi:hypothetical protein
MPRREVLAEFYSGARHGAFASGIGCLTAALLLIPFAAWLYALFFNPLALVFGLLAAFGATWVSDATPVRYELFPDDPLGLLMVSYIGAFAIVVAARVFRDHSWLNASRWRYHGIQIAAAFVSGVIFLLTVKLEQSQGQASTLAGRIQHAAVMGLTFSLMQAIGRALWVIGCNLNTRMTGGR